MAQSLANQHPDVVRVSYKFNRVQHHVNYKPFRKNKLIRVEGLKLENKINNYGMVLKSRSTGELIEPKSDKTQW